MRLKTPFCPKCGECANGTLEAMYGTAEFASFDPSIDNGEIEYGGYTVWDEKEEGITVKGLNGNLMLRCLCGNSWEDGTGLCEHPSGCMDELQYPS